MIGPIRGGSRLRTGKLSGTSVDPMSNVANISDAMLVLALAFMLALISYWNVSLPGAEQIQENATEVTDVNSAELESAGGGYEEAGTVYRDPKTGELYMVENGSAEGSSTGSSSSTSDSSDDSDK